MVADWCLHPIDRMFEFQWSHSHERPEAKRAKLAMISGREGWRTLFSQSQRAEQSIFLWASYTALWCRMRGSWKRCGWLVSHIQYLWESIPILTLLGWYSNSRVMVESWLTGWTKSTRKWGEVGKKKGISVKISSKLPESKLYILVFTLWYRLK